MNDFFKEMRRRNVFRVAGVYGVVGWLLAQAAAVLENALVLPGWFDTVVVSLLLIGFPVALILAWALEIAPDGVKLTASVPESESITKKTGRKLDYAILAGLALVAVIVLADRFWPDDRQTTLAAGDAAVSDEAAPAEDASPDAAAVSIAVLPFTDISPDGDQQYFSDGIAEEILNVLARVDGLKVAARTSSFRYRGGDKAVPEIATELGVQYVLEGSVRKAGDAIRVTAQLIAAQSDAHLWSKTYDRTLTVDNIFEIQDEISTGIVEEIGQGMGLGRANAIKFAAAAGTDDLRAYDAFLEGRELLLARYDAAPEDIIAKFEEVVRRDPEFARGWSALAAAYAVQEAWRNETRDYRALAVEAAEKALSLNPELAMPHGVIGMAARLPDGRPDKISAVRHLTRAIELDPTDPTLWSWRGQHLSELGFFDDAERDLHKAAEINPADRISLTWLFKNDLYQQEFDTAGGRAPESRFLNFFTNLHLLIADGRNEGVAERIRRFRENAPEQLISSAMVDALVEVMTDPDADADKIYADALALVQDDSRAELLQRPLWLYAFKQFDDLKNLPDLVGDAVWWLRGHEDYLQSPERYRLMHEQGLPDYWRAEGFPPQCRAIDPLPDGRDFECT